MHDLTLVDPIRIMLRRARCPGRASPKPLIAGGGARLLTATIVSPVELMRTRLQSSQALRSEGMIGGAMALVKREGWGALWKGLPPTLWRDVPFSMLYWTVYELLKARLLARGVASGFVSRTAEGQPAQLEPVHSFACGAASGAFAAFLTTPFDVLKTRHQVTDRPAHPVHQLSAQPPACKGSEAVRLRTQAPSLSWRRLHSARASVPSLPVWVLGLPRWHRRARS